MSSTAYRCISPMIQLTGPHTGWNAPAIETVFRNGDILPAWIENEDAARLLADGFIEEVVA